MAEVVILRVIRARVTPLQQRLEEAQVLTAPPHVHRHIFDNRGTIPHYDLPRILHELMESGYEVRLEPGAPLDEAPADYIDRTPAARDTLATTLREWADELA